MCRMESPEDVGQVKSSPKTDDIDVGDGFWRRDVGDGFGYFGHQDPLSFYISVGYQHSKDVTKIEILSAISKNFANFKSPRAPR